MDDQSITTADIAVDPRCVTAEYRLASGQRVVFRPLAAADAALLGSYFVALSAETRRRFGPHPLDQPTAARLCATIDVTHALRIVATIPAAGRETIIGYCILLLGVTDHERARYAQWQIALDTARDCTVAPSVADAYQNQGIGGPLLRHTIDVARRLGRRRVVLLGGTQATNGRAIHVYQRQGFRTVGSFCYPDGMLNYDMLLSLDRDA